jgi:ATP-dependent Clp protease ATP-binding subunit ClpA
MWQRFTERARKVVFYAQEAAQKSGDHFVSTEHILVGLLREKDSVATKVLEKLGADPDQIRKDAEKAMGSGPSRTSQDMTLTPRAKRVIDKAYAEARSLDNNYIGTEHLLLGLILDTGGAAGKVLAKHKVELDRARSEIMALQDNAAATVPWAAAPPSEGDDPKANEPKSESLKLVEARVGWDAKKRGARFISTPDYLAALFAFPDCLAMRTLKQGGADLDEIQNELERLRQIEPFPDATPMDDRQTMGMNAEAIRIAASMGDAHINTGHVLLAMFVTTWSAVYVILANQGLYYEHLWLLVAQGAKTET